MAFLQYVKKVLKILLVEDHVVMREECGLLFFLLFYLYIFYSPILIFVWTIHLGLVVMAFFQSINVIAFFTIVQLAYHLERKITKTVKHQRAF